MLVEPLRDHTFGAVIRNFNISAALAADSVRSAAWRQRCLQLFERHGLLIYKGQTLTPAEELAFALSEAGTRPSPR